MSFKLYVSSLLVLICCCNANQLSAQDFVTKKNASKKAMKAYNEGYLLNGGRNYSEAVKLFTKALKHEPTFVDALNMRADSYQGLRDLENAEKDFEASVALAPDHDMRVYYILGLIERQQDKYAEAAEHFEQYLARNPRNEDVKRKVTRLMKSSHFAAKAKANPFPYQLINMGENINSQLSETLPTLTADGNTLLFTRKVGRQEDFYVSFKDKDGSWSKAQDIGPPINTDENEGAETISANGKILVYTVCNRPEDFGSCDLYISELKKNRWSRPKNLGPTINTEKWESQPALSADGKELYFTSSRKGGKGGTDIWVSTRQANGQFSKPKSLNINSIANDASPFIHADNETLYFTSTGNVCIGGVDLFMSKRQADGTWGEPVNLGYPINTQQDEGALIIGLDGKTAYFASDKAGGLGRFDLYTFEMPEQFRAKPVTYVKGTVYSAASRKKLSAHVEITDINENKQLQDLETSRDGDFLVCLPVGVDYRLAVEKEGFVFHSENFALKEATTIDKPYELKIYLQPIQPTVQTTDKPEPVYRPTILKNVFFESGSAVLNPRSRTELQALLKLLTDNPEMRIQINGHTDNVGNETDNLKLSQNRAKSVVDYLIDAGINVSRLESKGFGESQPIDTNETKSGRKNNRRTEFIIIQ